MIFFLIECLFRKYLIIKNKYFFYLHLILIKKKIVTGNVMKDKYLIISFFGLKLFLAYSPTISVST